MEFLAKLNAPRVWEFHTFQCMIPVGILLASGNISAQIWKMNVEQMCLDAPELFLLPVDVASRKQDEYEASFKKYWGTKKVSLNELNQRILAEEVINGHGLEYDLAHEIEKADDQINRIIEVKQKELLRTELEKRRVAALHELSQERK